MFTAETVRDCINNYYVKDEKVYRKDNNEEIKNEDLILMVKTSTLIYAKAKHNYQRQKHQLGEHFKQADNYKMEYIKKAIERYGVNGDVNAYGENKLINNIINSSGMFEEEVLGKPEYYEIFHGNNKHYGIALMQLKYRSMGKNMTDFKVQIDKSRLTKDGITKMRVMTQTEKFIPKDNLSQSELDSMTDNMKVTYLENKANQYKAIGDEDLYNYYMANAERIKNNMALRNSSSKKEVQPTAKDMNQISNQNSEEKSIIEDSNNSIADNQKPQVIYNSYQEINNTDLYYDNMIKAIKEIKSKQSLTEEEKKELIGQAFYYEGYLVANLTTETEALEVITKLYSDLDTNDTLGMKIADAVLGDIQEKFSSKKKSQNTSNIVNNGIALLENEYNEIMREYNEMRKEAFDDDIAQYIINRLEQLYNQAISVRDQSSSKKEIQEIDNLLNIINQNKSQIYNMIYRARDIAEGFSR